MYLSYKIFEQNNLESANATKKTILQNKTGTIVRTENRLDSAVNQSVRHGLNGKTLSIWCVADSQRDDEMQSIRTPKRLLIKSKRAKNVESTNSNLKSGLIKSSHLRKKARKKNRKTVKGTDEVVAISPEENTNFSYFGKDFVRPKNYKTGQNHQSKYLLLKIKSISDNLFCNIKIEDSSFNKKEFSKPSKNFTWKAFNNNSGQEVKRRALNWRAKGSKRNWQQRNEFSTDKRTMENLQGQSIILITREICWKFNIVFSFS